VQQAMIRVQPNKEGRPQSIAFPQLADQTEGTKSIKLAATSDAGLPVSYYVREGPGEIDGDTLTFTAIPPRSKFPVRVTIVAWQWGRSAEPKVQTATRAEMSFSIVKP
jgi:hypothetical protein